MKLSLFNRILIGFLISLLLILLLGGLNLFSSFHLTDCYRKLEQSKNKVLLLEETASLVKDVQRAHRGFVVTRDKRFLDRYYHSLEVIPTIKAKLTTTAYWLSSQVDEVRVLSKLIDAKLALADDALVRTNSFNADTVRMKIMEGKVVVDSIHQTIGRLKQSELLQQEQIHTEIQKWLSMNRTVIVSSVVVFIVLLLIGLLQIRNVLTARYQLYKDLQSRGSELADMNEKLQTLNEELLTSNESLAESVAKLEKAQSAIYLREKQLNHAQLITRTGSFSYNLRSKDFSYSDSYASILELKNGETISSLPDFILLVHPEDRDYIVRSSNAFLTNEEVTFQEFRLLIGGRVKYIRAAGQVVHENGGEIFLGAITDVTELTVAHQALQEANRKLTESNADLEAFTYSISHDLKAPVRSMLMYIHLLLDKAGETNVDEEKEWLNVLLRKGRQMDEMIEGLLSLSRYGPVSLKKQEVNIADLVRDILDEMTPEFPRATVSLSSPLGKITADDRLIRQVWTNLIQNALKFTSKADQPRITIGREDRDGYAWFSIEDNGVGFEQSRASELFTVFRRLHSTSEFRGSGVGLAIVKRIILSHGGDIEAFGEAGRGSVFRFRLPTI